MFEIKLYNYYTRIPSLAKTKDINRIPYKSAMNEVFSASISSQLNAASITKLEVDTACAYDQTPLIFCMNACFIETEQIQFIVSFWEHWEKMEGVQFLDRMLSGL